MSKNFLGKEYVKEPPGFYSRELGPPRTRASVVSGVELMMSRGALHGGLVEDSFGSEPLTVSPLDRSRAAGQLCRPAPLAHILADL